MHVHYMWHQHHYCCIIPPFRLGLEWKEFHSSEQGVENGKYMTWHAVHVYALFYYVDLVHCKYLHIHVTCFIMCNA